MHSKLLKLFFVLLAVSLFGAGCGKQGWQTLDKDAFNDRNLGADQQKEESYPLQDFNPSGPFSKEAVDLVIGTKVKNCLDRAKIQNPIQWTGLAGSVESCVSSSVTGTSAVVACDLIFSLPAEGKEVRKRKLAAESCINNALGLDYIGGGIKVCDKPKQEYIKDYCLFRVAGNNRVRETCDRISDADMRKRCLRDEFGIN